MKQVIIPIKIFAVAFLLNLIWENAQAPLYQGYTSFTQHFWICLPASLGDAGYITAVYLVIALIVRDACWIQKMSNRTKKVFWIFTMIVTALGLVTAGYIELRALAQGRWAYTAAMPLVPFTTIGLTPFLQLALLSLATYAIAFRIFRRNTRRAILVL